MGFKNKRKSLLFKFVLINRVPSPEIAETKQGTFVKRDIIPPYR